MLDIRAYLSIMLDPIRVAIAGHAVVGPVDAASLAAEMDLPERQVLEAIGKLKAIGLLDAEGALDRGVLRALAVSLPQMPPPSPEVAAKGVWTADEAQVLSRFFSAERLTSIPTAQAKRRIVVERLAMEFEPGIRYQEPEVNFTLQMWHADYAALRRYLVDEGFMDRADGAYWRTGGRYAPDGDA